MRVFIADQTPPGQPDGLPEAETPLRVNNRSIGPAPPRGETGGGLQRWGGQGRGSGAVVIRHEVLVIAESRIAADPKGSTSKMYLIKDVPNAPNANKQDNTNNATNENNKGNLGKYNQ